MNLLRTSDELDTLRADLRAVQRDLRALSGDIGTLTSQAWRARGSAGDWLRRAAGVDLSTDHGREEALRQLRAQGERSAAAVRATVQDHPLSAALGALAVGLAVVWFVTRSSDAK